MTPSATPENYTTLTDVTLERLCPPRRDRPTPFEMPALKEAADARDAFAAIIAATAEGELTPSEAATFAKLITDFADIDAATQTDRSAREHKKRYPHLRPFGLPRT
jgi:hypothetical protein